MGLGVVCRACMPPAHPRSLPTRDCNLGRYGYQKCNLLGAVLSELRYKARLAAFADPCVALAATISSVVLKFLMLFVIGKRPRLPAP